MAREMNTLGNVDCTDKMVSYIYEKAGRTSGHTTYPQAKSSVFTERSKCVNYISCVHLIHQQSAMKHHCECVYM